MSTKILNTISGLLLIVSIVTYVNVGEMLKRSQQLMLSKIEHLEMSWALKQLDFENLMRIKMGNDHSLAVQDKVNRLLYGWKDFCSLSDQEYFRDPQKQGDRYCKKCFQSTRLRSIAEYRELVIKHKILDSGLSALHGNNCHWLYPGISLVQDKSTREYYIASRYSHESTWLYEIEVNGEIGRGSFPYTFSLDTAGTLRVTTKKYAALIGTGKMDTIESTNIINLNKAINITL